MSASLVKARGVPGRSVARALGRLSYHARLVAAAMGLSPLLPRRIEPMALSVRLSDRCNSRCVTCRCWQLREGPEIGTEAAIRLVEDARDLGIRALRVTGGEPLLRADLFTILERCRGNDFDRVVVTTNGLLLERLAAEINASPITHLTVSLDGVGDRNDSIRGVPGGYEAVVRGLARIERKRIKVVSTMSKALTQDLEALMQFCRRRGYAFDVNLPTTAPYFFAGEGVAEALEGLWPDGPDVDRMVALLREHEILSGPLLEFVGRYLKERRSTMRHCLHGYCLVGVEPDGSINPGCYGMPVGNIASGRLADVLRSSGYAAAARRMFELECPTCPCGYALSVAYERPLVNLGYVRRRLVDRARTEGAA